MIGLITISDQEDIKRHYVSVARQHFVVLRGQFALKHIFIENCYFYYYCYYYSFSFRCVLWHPIKSSTTPPGLWTLYSKFLSQSSSNLLQIHPSIFSLLLPFWQSLCFEFISLFVLSVCPYHSNLTRFYILYNVCPF